jgi:hypothetical protein
LTQRSLRCSRVSAADLSQKNAENISTKISMDRSCHLLLACKF